MRTLRKVISFLQPLARFSSVSTSTKCDLSEFQLELQKTAREFTESHVIPTANRYDSSGEFPWHIHELALENGLTPNNVPSLFDQCLIGEEIATGCSAIYASMATTATATSPFYARISCHLKNEYLELLSKYPVAAASVLTTTNVQGTKKDSSYILRSGPAFIENAGNASFFVVIAKTDSQCTQGYDYTGFVVDKHLLGVSVGQKLQTTGQRCTDFRSLAFENVSIPLNNILGKEGEGRMIAQLLDARSSLLHAVCNLGIARHSLEILLSESASIKDDSIKLPMMARIESSRLLVRKAANQIDRGHMEDGLTTADLAKLCSSDAAVSNVGQTMQTLGRLSDDSDLTKLFRDASQLNCSKAV